MTAIDLLLKFVTFSYLSTAVLEITRVMVWGLGLDKL